MRSVRVSVRRRRGPEDDAASAAMFGVAIFGWSHFTYSKAHHGGRMSNILSARCARKQRSPQNALLIRFNTSNSCNIGSLQKQALEKNRSSGGRNADTIEAERRRAAVQKHSRLAQCIRAGCVSELLR